MTRGLHESHFCVFYVVVTFAKMLGAPEQPEPSETDAGRTEHEVGGSSAFTLPARRKVLAQPPSRHEVLQRFRSLLSATNPCCCW